MENQNDQNTQATRRNFLAAGLAVTATTVASAKTNASLIPNNSPEPDVTKAFVDGIGPDWHELTGKDFVNVNCHKDTWRWEEGKAFCTGKPTGVIRSKKKYTNFEMVAQWRHMQRGGNSGIFVWAIDKSLERLKGPGLPHGIEVQVLDIHYKEKYMKMRERRPNLRPPNWFTSHGDVFPVGAARMKPFAPMAPNKRRSFPSKDLVRDTGIWNHYYIRAINGEVRLWVNGEEVSGGTNCKPATGYLCLESEGAPVEFKNLRLRELP